MRNAHSDSSFALSWFALSLLLHGALFGTMRFWTPEHTLARVPETIQVSLIEMASESIKPPAPLPPAPPEPVVAPKPRPVKQKPEPTPEPEPETPPQPEAPEETPTPPAPESAPESASPAPASPPASANSNNANPNSAPPSALVEARFDAAYLHNPKPPYPLRAKQLHEEGTVHLRVHVLPDGKTDQVDIRKSSGFPRLDESARMTVLRWRFIPGRRGSEVVTSWVIVPIHFNLENSP